MQGGESCRNICVVPFSLCKTTTLRVELPLLLCNLHKRHQILIIVNIITINSAIIKSVCSLSSLWLNLKAGVDSISSPPFCQHHNWRFSSSAPSKLVGCRHLKWSIMLLKFFFTSTGVICVSREKWSNQTRRFPLIWSLSVHKDFMHWSALKLPPHTQFGCFTPLLA